MRYLATGLALLGAALLPACETTDTPHYDAHQGESVAHMIEAQTYDPYAAVNPPALAPEVGDGQRLKNAIDASRKDVGAGTESVNRQRTFDAGQQQQQ
jgi:hypothetical protein